MLVFTIGFQPLLQEDGEEGIKEGIWLNMADYFSKDLVTVGVLRCVYYECCWIEITIPGK